MTASTTAGASTAAGVSVPVGVSASGCAVDIDSVTATEVHARVEVPASDPVFAGHYPGFPVLPGVYLIEFADRVARTWLTHGLPHGPTHGPAHGPRDGRGVRLAAIDSCRFRGPVYPGEPLEIRLRGVAGELSCTVSLSTPAGAAADLKLRYQDGVA